jgi:hypothetical protein
MLYQKTRIERNGRLLKLKEFKKDTERYLTLMDLNKKEIPRRTLYYWISTYGESYKKVSHKKALQFVAQHQRIPTKDEIENLSKEYDEYMQSTKPTYKDYLKYLQEMYNETGLKILFQDELLKNKKTNKDKSF